MMKRFPAESPVEKAAPKRLLKLPWEFHAFSRRELAGSRVAVQPGGGECGAGGEPGAGWMAGHPTPPSPSETPHPMPPHPGNSSPHPDGKGHATAPDCHFPWHLTGLFQGFSVTVFREILI